MVSCCVFVLSMEGLERKCLAGYNACFGFGKMDHKIRYYPSVAKDKGDNH